MTCIAVFGQKGGTGKTTLALNFAVEAFARGVKVVVLDNDQQASASAWGKRRGVAPFVVTAAGKPLKDVVPELVKEYDLVLIDTAPHTYALSTEAVRLADRVLIPCRPSILDLDAMDTSTAVVRRMNKPAAIVLNQCPPNHGLIQEAMASLTRHQVAVCPITIGARASMTYAMIAGQVTREYEPRGKGAKEIADVWDWILEKLQ